MAGRQAEGAAVTPAPALRGDRRLPVRHLILACLLKPCLAVLLGLDPVVGAAAEAPDARAAGLLAAAAAATGGSAWDRLRELHVVLKRQTGEDAFDEELWVDPHQGLFVLAIEDGPEASRLGWDGRVAWRADSDGDARPLKEAARADLIAEAAWRSVAWIRPAPRPPGGAFFLREEGQGSHARDVIRLTAADGSPLEIAFDRASHLPVRLGLHRPGGDAIIRLSQWRRTDGVTVPTRIETDAGSVHTVETVTSTIASTVADPHRFDLPTAPPVDYVFPGDAVSAELPLKLLNGHAFVETHLAKTRLHMLLATAAPTALDRLTVDRLGLHPHAGPGGTLSVSLPEFGVRRGDAPPSGGRGPGSLGFAALEGLPVDGILGVELARRLVVELDYDGRRLVLLRPDGFVPPPSATPVPLVFVGRMATIAGRVDGLLASLVLDTATAEGLVLGERFAGAHGFAQKWHAVPALVALGSAPPALGLVGRAASLELGVLGLAQPVGWLAPDLPATADGLLGTEILRRYDTISGLPARPGLAAAEPVGCSGRGTGPGRPGAGPAAGRSHHRRHRRRWPSRSGRAQAGRPGRNRWRRKGRNPGPAGNPRPPGRATRRRGHAGGPPQWRPRLLPHPAGRPAGGRPE